jgi:hypothetical protein
MANVTTAATTIKKSFKKKLNIGSFQNDPGRSRPAVNGCKFVGYGRLRHHERPYTVVYARRNDRPG